MGRPGPVPEGRRRRSPPAIARPGHDPFRHGRRRGHLRGRDQRGGEDSRPRKARQRSRRSRCSLRSPRLRRQGLDAPERHWHSQRGGRQRLRNRGGPRRGAPPQGAPRGREGPAHGHRGPVLGRRDGAGRLVLLRRSCPGAGRSHQGDDQPGHGRGDERRQARRAGQRVGAAVEGASRCHRRGIEAQRLVQRRWLWPVGPDGLLCEADSGDPLLHRHPRPLPHARRRRRCDQLRRCGTDRGDDGARGARGGER